MVVLAGELLREAEQLVNQKIHPMTIIAGTQRQQSGADVLCCCSAGVVGLDVEYDAFCHAVMVPTPVVLPDPRHARMLLRLMSH